MTVIRDWFTGQKPHFGNPKGQKLLKDRFREWGRVTPNKPCEIPGDTHICADEWCMRRRDCR